MDLTKDEQALIWLSAFSSLELSEKTALLRRASPSEIFERYEKCVSPLHGDVPPLAERKREIEALLAELGEKGYFAVTSISSDYPEALRAADPPLVLFGAGRRELLRERKFCIVGSRITPAWAETHCMRVAEELSKHFAIVTGLAEGGDRAAIRGALMSGKLICVLPNGLDTCYPAAHTSLKEEVRRTGLLLSEYLPSETAKKYSFHARNRILAGISEGTLVVSAGEHSGALITAYNAVDYGRDVFAFPYNPGIAQGVGCNELLKKGAYVCTDAEDILGCYGFSGREQREIALSEREDLVLGILKEEGELHTAVLAERAKIPVYEVSALLSALELKGLVVKAGGNRYHCI